MRTIARWWIQRAVERVRARQKARANEERDVPRELAAFTALHAAALDAAELDRANPAVAEATVERLIAAADELKNALSERTVVLIRESQQRKAI